MYLIFEAMKKILSLLLFAAFSNVIVAQDIPVEILNTQDSIKVLLTKDLQKVYPHKVKAKQTLYSIAKLFELPVTYLRKINRLEKDAALDLNQEIFIPLRDNLIRTDKPANVEDYIPVVYKVKSKETIFRISRIYFDIETDQLKSNNQLTEDKLDIGQYLTIGWFKINTGSTLEQENMDLDSVIVETVEDSIARIDTSFVVIKPKYKKGIAYWDKSSATNQLFVLHKTAKVNSEIELYNPVQGIRTMAKVVAHIPRNTYPDDIDVILSPATAKQLGALDSRFLVEMKYFE